MSGQALKGLLQNVRLGPVVLNGLRARHRDSSKVIIFFIEHVQSMPRVETESMTRKTLRRVILAEFCPLDGALTIALCFGGLAPVFEY